MHRFLTGLTFVCCFLGVSHAADLRIGFVKSSHPEGCFQQNELSDEGAVAYAEHLAERFNSDLYMCFGEQAIASSDGTVKLIWGAREALAGFLDQYRPFLTPRRPDGLGRVPIVVFKKTSDPRGSIEQFRGTRLVLSDRDPKALNTDMPYDLLGDLGFGREDFETVWADGTMAVVQSVASGETDIGALELTSWARVCNAYISDHDHCSQLDVLVKSRPRAEHGMIIRNDSADEIRLRMVGVHARMHFENPQAFLWLVGPDAPELEPAEAEAFSIGLTE